MTSHTERPTRRSRQALLGVSLGSTAALAFHAACGGGAEPEAAPADSERRGAELYEQNCASCHGSDLRGTEKGPS